MNAEIRRATAEDIPHVAALEQELVRGDAPGDPYLVRDLQRQDVEEQYHTLIASDWAVCLVATHQGEVVGYLSGGWKDSPKWRPVKATEIHALYLREAFRSQGIGRRLIEEFVRWSEERDAAVVEVGAFAANTRAVTFYERAGFRPTLVHLERPVGPPADAHGASRKG
jgi:ribosomal protein S18 acetylase RimI-like enzyme